MKLTNFFSTLAVVACLAINTDAISVETGMFGLGLSKEKEDCKSELKKLEVSIKAYAESDLLKAKFPPSLNLLSIDYSLFGLNFVQSSETTKAGIDVGYLISSRMEYNLTHDR